jgi:hypothetical protein
MSVEELYYFTRLPRDQRRRTDLPIPNTGPVDFKPFRHGYVAGWRSVRPDHHPTLIPPSPVFVRPLMYMVGFSRGARDAGA